MRWANTSLLTAAQLARPGSSKSCSAPDKRGEVLVCGVAVGARSLLQFGKAELRHAACGLQKRCVCVL